MDDEISKLIQSSRVLKAAIKDLNHVWDDSVAKAVRKRFFAVIEDEEVKEEVYFRNQASELAKINHISKEIQDEIIPIEKDSIEIENLLNLVETQINIIQQKLLISKDFILAAEENKNTSMQNLIQAKSLMKKIGG
jgi:hypothetical protein